MKMTMFCFIIYMYFLSIMKLQKNSLNKITNEHLSSILRISTSQIEPDYDKVLKEQLQIHFLTCTIKEW